MTPKSKLFDPKLFLAKVGEGRKIAEYRKNQVVFSQQDQADSIFYIQKGKVKLTVVSNAGKEAVIAVLGAGDFLGEGCLANRPVRLATATAIFKLLDRSAGEGSHDPCAPRGAGFFRDVHGLCPLAEHAD